MSRAGPVDWSSLVCWGSALTFAASLVTAGCGSGGSAGGGSGGTGGAAGDSGADTGSLCGNGVVDGNEECDNGPKNAPGSGCETDCHTSCHADTDCDDSDPCNGVEKCVSNKAGRACVAGTPMADGASCTAGGYCKSGVCTQPVCGNGTVEPGEDCEPPNTSTCSKDCKTVVCGDGVIAGTEQCDDGNTTNFDGCDSNCRYETVMRLTSFVISRDAVPSYCVHPDNAVGTALLDEVVKGFNDNIQATIDGGGYNEMLMFRGLDDLTGVNAANLSLGILWGTTDPNYPGTWGPTAIDEWYLADSTTIDPKLDIPTSIFSPASISSHLIKAGPSRVDIHIVTGTTPSDFDSLDTKIEATTDTSPAPSVPGAPPSALAPGLKVFQSLTATGADQGLCGVVTVASIAAVPLPQDFCWGVSPYACQPASKCSGSRTYTSCTGGVVGPGCNSLLDLLVGGCKSTDLCALSAAPTQPDIGTGGNPPAPLAPGTNNKVAPSVPTDGYSFLIHFAATRAHLTNNLP